jgi:hypothetical protein
MMTEGKMAEQIEVKEIQMVAANGKSIRKVTRIIIDGHNIDFTEKLTKAQVRRYLAARTAFWNQQLAHAAAESMGG